MATIKSTGKSTSKSTGRKSAATKPNANRIRIGTRGAFTKKIAGNTAKKNRNPAKKMGGVWVTPTLTATKLAPRHLVGQMMGAWFLATSLGNLIAGRLAGEFKTDELGRMPMQFLQMVILPMSVALVLIALAMPIRKMMVGVK